MNSGIIAFLKSVTAKVPESFETEPQIECDDVLTLLADELSHVELVNSSPSLNIEYSKNNPATRISVSDSGLPLTEPEEMPIHRRKS